MKIKMYTKSHSEALLKEIDNNGGQFTAAEHAYVVETDFGKEFETKENLMRWYLRSSSDKLPALAFLMKYVNANGYKNILSLGAGQCVLEYLLRYALPEDSNVIAADFDSFFIKKAKLHFPSIIPVEFDFFKDDLEDLQKKLNIYFDLAVFWGSAYVMDNSNFVKLFRELKEIGVKRIIDFHAGYIPRRRILQIICSRLMSYVVSKLRRIEMINKIIPPSYRGKFHGYGRTRGELRRVYKQAGLVLIQETAVGSYEYVAICK